MLPRRLVFGLLLSALAWAQPETLTRLGQEYQELRKQPGHFTGGGQWNAAVDKWGGRKHQVMGQLAELLKGQSTELLLSTMAGPDRRYPTPDGRVRWVYYWRGGHDYLFFDCRASHIERVDWWMAGE